MPNQRKILRNPSSHRDSEPTNRSGRNHVFLGFALWLGLLPALIVGITNQSAALTDAASEPVDIGSIFTGLVLRGYDAELSGLTTGTRAPLRLYWTKRQDRIQSCFCYLALLDRERKLVIPVAPPFQVSDTTTVPGVAFTSDTVVELPLRYGSGAYDLAVRSASTEAGARSDQLADQYWRKITTLTLKPGVVQSELTDHLIESVLGAGWSRLRKTTAVRRSDSVELTLDSPSDIAQIAMVSVLRFARLIPQGQVVAAVQAKTVTGELRDLELRAGIDTTEGYSGDQAYPPKHQKALEFPMADVDKIPQFYTKRHLGLQAVVSLRINYTADEGLLIIEDLLYR